MITASHQTFFGQIKHLSGQAKFGQTNLLYIINENFKTFGQFSVLAISTVNIPVFSNTVQIPYTAKHLRGKTFANRVENGYLLENICGSMFVDLPINKAI